MTHPKSHDPSQVIVSPLSESRYESRKSKRVINVDSLTQEGLSESESERSENDLVKTQDYIKEIKIKARNTGGKSAIDGEENTEAAAGQDENQKWKIFDPQAHSSQYKVHLIGMKIQ